MALTYTPGAELGESFHHFQLKDVEGRKFDTQEIPDENGIVLMFICNHCPYVQAIEDRLIDLGREYKDKKVSFFAICSNDPTDHPEDAPQELLRRSREKSYPFPYLVDENQDVAKAFGAVCTPDLFVYDEKKHLFYRGRLDDSWKAPEKVKKRDLSVALDLMLDRQPPPQDQIPSMGCSIKWK